MIKNANILIFEMVLISYYTLVLDYEIYFDYKQQMSSQQQSLVRTNVLCLQLRDSSNKHPLVQILWKENQNQKNSQISSKESKIELHSYKQSPIYKIGLIIALILALASGLWLYYQYDSKGLNIDYSSSRLLNEMSFKDSIPKRLSADEVPRWYDLNKQNQQFVYKPNSPPLPSYMDFKPSTSLQVEEKEDALSIIFDYSTQLNYEIVAAITGEKMKLGSKLLDLNHKPNQHEKFIYEYESQFYESRYNISLFEEKPICVIVPTFHNAQENRDQINIRSIIKQQYSNYHIVIIDDASRDKTADRIQLELDRNHFDPSRYVLIRNKEQMKAMHNIRTAAKKYCHPEEIMIIIDGDDELVGRQVFKLFNTAFQKEDAWFVYSNFIDIASKNVGYSRQFPKGILEQNSYRDYLFLTSHLRAFYTKLFLRIREEDLKDMTGKYYEAANDVAICLPILQMSHKRVYYLPELTYGYNSNTGNNNHIVRASQQSNNNQAIRKKSRYTPLTQLSEI